MSAVDLAEKLRQFDKTWAPRVVADYNGNDIMVVKVEGAFVWHSHPETDDFFLVLSGEVAIEMREEVVLLKPGQLYVVPAGVEHRPVARVPSEVMIIEPAGTPNTGDPNTAVTKQHV
ncbi:MAG: cupin domain-containing protein [Pseudomonadota bacterium]